MNLIDTSLDNKNKADWFKLYKFGLIKITYSFITIFLIILSLFVTIVSVSILFFLNLDANKFFVNLQFYLLIFYGILLFIFVLMNTIKIFGTQFEDSSFLLLLTKPYSRKVIIMTQYLNLFSINFIFIILNIWLLLVIGGILGITMNVPYLSYYLIVVLKLFGYLILFSILVTTGIVSVLSFVKSQITFLIFIIFCSLFLLGGLPYSIMKLETDSTQILFQDGTTYNVKTIKQAILFSKYLNAGLIKYPNLTKTIYNFYIKLDINDLNNINSPNVINARINLYNTFSLEKTGVVKTANGSATYWDNDFTNHFTNKDLIIKMTFSNYFITLDELKKTAKDNLVKADLLQIIEDYDQEIGIRKFMELQKSKAPALLTYDDNINNTNININGTVEAISPDVLNNIFLRDQNYKLDGRFRNQYNAIFYNPVYYVLRCVEDYIYTQCYTYYKISNEPIVRDANFLKLESTTSFYKVINAVNFIEQWNQIWTSFMGYYGDFWFEPLASSSINFETQQNSLFSYPDFKISVVNKKINTTNIQYFQQNAIVISVYAVIIIFLFFFSYFMFMQKKIS